MMNQALLRTALLLLALGVASPATGQTGAFVPFAGPWHTATPLDGDSLVLAARAGFVRGIEIRLAHIDSPELRGRCAEERALAVKAVERLRELSARGIRIVTHLEADRYGRIVSQAFDRQGRDIGALLVAEGLARPYRGDTARETWCPVLWPKPE